MKNFKSLLSYLAVFTLLFASCSKEETGDSLSPDSDKATVSFATVLNDMVTNHSALKQAMEIPECSDASPAYVEVVLTGTTNVGTEQDPLVVAVNPNAADYDGDSEAEYFTEESAELELEPGPYTLEHFVVYDGDPSDPASNIIWVAPREGGDLAEFVDNPLPSDFNLGAGVKKYVDVDVLCYDNRMVNEYGYLFFDIEGTEAIEFCIFGNYCDENGRHFPAEFSVSVWTYENGEMGSLIHSDITNSVALDDNGDYAATPVCIPLPDTEGLDEYYFEITLLDSDAYGDVENSVIRSGVINDDEVKSFFDGEDNLDYYHFREGCGDTDNPPIFDEPGDVANYKSCLLPLNDSGALAFAYFRLEDNVLQTTVLATNVEANMMHAQHVHGLEDDSNATCPPETADEDGDGLISLAEGLPFYGGVLLPLTEEGGDYPSANGSGMIIYERTYSLGVGDIPAWSTLDPFENRVVVLHGMTVDGEYVGSLPIACGQVKLLD